MSKAPTPDPLDWSAALDRLTGAYADRTIAEYRADFSRFKAWCSIEGHTPLPASAETLAAFVAAQVITCAPRTAKRRLLVVRRIHKLLELADFSQHDLVTLAYRRALRAKGSPPRQALGLSARLRDRLIAASPLDLKGVRDRAMIAVGYETLCRRLELVSLRLEDVTWTLNGAAKILIRRAKNDPFGESRYAYISSLGAGHLQAWLKAARIGSGPIFRPTYRVAVGSHALHPRAVNRVLQEAAKRAGVDEATIARLSGHSFRVGAAQDLAVAGRTPLQIMRAGRWTHIASVERYVRQADVNVWADHG